MGIEVTITGAGNTAIAIPGEVYEAFSQSFPSGSGFNLSSVSLKLALGTGTPGIVYCDIYAVDGSDFPTGSSLGTASVNSSTFNTHPSWSYPIFTFSPTVTLAASTQYCFVLSTSSGSWNSHYIYMGATIGNPYASGLMSGYNGADWVDQSNFDIRATIRSPDVTYAEGTKSVTSTWTVTPAPGKATTPTPTDDQGNILITGVNQLKQLAWVAPGGETPDYQVYFRAQGGTWQLQETITDNSLSHTLSAAILAAFNYYSIYEWKIDTRHADTGWITEGDTWTFISQQDGNWTQYNRRSDYDADQVWQPGTGWVDANSFEFTGGGRYKQQLVVVGHKVIYFGEL